MLTLCCNHPVLACCDSIRLRVSVLDHPGLRQTQSQTDYYIPLKDVITAYEPHAPRSHDRWMEHSPELHANASR